MYQRREESEIFSTEIRLIKVEERLQEMSSMTHHLTGISSYLMAYDLFYDTQSCIILVMTLVAPSQHLHQLSMPQNTTSRQQVLFFSFDVSCYDIVEEHWQEQIRNVVDRVAAVEHTCSTNFQTGFLCHVLIICSFTTASLRFFCFNVS